MTMRALTIGLGSAMKTIALIVYSDSDTIYYAAVHRDIEMWQRGNGRILHDTVLYTHFNDLHTAHIQFEKELKYLPDLRPVDFATEFVQLKDE